MVESNDFLHNLRCIPWNGPWEGNGVAVWTSNIRTRGHVYPVQVIQEEFHHHRDTRENANADEEATWGEYGFQNTVKLNLHQVKILQIWVHCKWVALPCESLYRKKKKREIPVSKFYNYLQLWFRVVSELWDDCENVVNLLRPRFPHFAWCPSSNIQSSSDVEVLTYVTASYFIHVFS